MKYNVTKLKNIFNACHLKPLNLEESYVSGNYDIVCHYNDMVKGDLYAIVITLIVYEGPHSLGFCIDRGIRFLDPIRFDVLSTLETQANKLLDLISNASIEGKFKF